jgi:hypothetical protein
VQSKCAEANWEFNRQKKGKTCKAAFHPMTLSSSDEYHLKVCFIRIEEPSSPEMDVGGFEFGRRPSAAARSGLGGARKDSCSLKYSSFREQLSLFEAPLPELVEGSYLRFRL